MNCSKNSVLDLLHLFCCLLRQCPESTPCLIITSSIWCLQKSGINLGVNYHESSVVRGVTKGGKRGTIPRALKSPNNVTSTSFSTVHLLPKGLRFEYWGAKLTSCLERHMASLRPWLWWVLQQIITHKPTLPSHRSLIGFNFRQDMLHKNAKFYFKVIWPIEAHYIHLTNILFLWNNVYEFLGTNHCIPKRWPMGPLQLRFPPGSNL